MAEYDPQTIERNWQGRWEVDRAFEADVDPKRPKYYVLEMLPYPSGTLHMGHMRNYTIGDAVARYKRMRGYNVLHPMGWDAFGLPAENAAIQQGTPPQVWTKNNIAEFRRVLRRFGFSYDWRREISTCEPEYYRWNQWFFLRMLEKGLAYRKRSKVNWCPKDQTVLANEQVVDGRCWRHLETPVEVKEIEQWFLKITEYADELLEDLKQLEGGWPERVLVMQRNWIGKSQGARVRFPVEDLASGAAIEVFTTRMDTIYGASAIILAPDHPLVPTLLSGVPGEAALRRQLEPLKKQIIRDAELASLEKQGFFTGRYAVHPFTQQKIPIWTANFVLAQYGTGAVMCVPAHDQRDFEFAEKYQLPKPIVVEPADGKRPLGAAPLEAAYTEYGRLVNSGPYTGLTSQQAIERMVEDAKKNGFGDAQTIYRLKDWGISRQRYWGTPIPVMYCDRCGLVPDDRLPVLLPVNVQITGSGQSPLASAPEFVNTRCVKCGGPARRETDTMDTFIDSSWYFYRYTDPHNSKAPFDPAVVRYWFPIDQYIGGIVHAILHLLYARFFCKVMRDLGLVNHDEPITRLFTQGNVLKGGTAMSKSKGNIVAAEDMATKYGCDTGRMYTLFAAPPEKDLEWSEQGIEGCSRFLHRLYRLFSRHAERVKGVAAVGRWSPEALEAATEKEKTLLRKAHQTLRRVTHDFEARWHFNTSVALIMELVNEMQAQEPLAEGARPAVVREVLELTTLMLAPIAPHLAEELWGMLGHPEGLVRASWPEHLPLLAKEEQVEVVVQINGRVRGKIRVESGLSEEELSARAVADARVAQLMAGQRVIKIIVVPNKLVNIVLTARETEKRKQAVQAGEADGAGTIPR